MSTINSSNAEGDDPQLDFESALAEVQKIVAQLERGETTLEQSLQRFEQGVKLLALCRTRLDAAKARVRQFLYLDENGNPCWGELRPEATPGNSARHPSPEMSERDAEDRQTPRSEKSSPPLQRGKPSGRKKSSPPRTKGTDDEGEEEPADGFLF